MSSTPVAMDNIDLDLSSACRKLAFSDGTPLSAATKNLDKDTDLNSPLAKKSKGPYFSPLVRNSPLSHSENERNSPNLGVKQNLQEDSPRRKKVKNKRRSVCTKRCVSPDDDIVRSRSSEDENKENDHSHDVIESDADNTMEESLRITKKPAVRNRLVSESGSDSASAFEVEESTGDELDEKESTADELENEH